MDFESLKFLAKYPFLEEAKEYVNSLNLTLSDLKEHPVYSITIELGRQRVINSVNKKSSFIEASKNEDEINDKILAEFSILSYVVARILANLTRNKLLIERYIDGEIERIYDFLKKESDENLKKIISDLNLKIDGAIELGKIEIPFQDYLKFTKNIIKGKEKVEKSRWKLVNRELIDGKVKINNKSELIELIAEAIREKISLESSTALPKRISQRYYPEKFINIARNLNSLLGIEKFKKVGVEWNVKRMNEDAFPPCIKSLLKSLRLGEISHNGMFILATFFINLGLDKKRIVKIFSVFPKFSEEKTLYQIEFLSGEKSNVKYSCPNCEKIKSYGLCPKDCGVKHPLSYYFNYLKKHSKKK